MKKNRFSSATALALSMGVHMSAAERRAGRLMRDGTGHGGQSPAPTPAPSPTPSPAPSAAFNFQETLASIDAVPEPLKSLYIKQDDGSYKFENVSGLRSALEAERSAARSARGELSSLKQFKELGMTAEEIQNIVRERKEAETNRLKKEGDFTALETQMRETFEKKEQEYKEREKRLKAKIERLMIDDSARSILADPSIQGNPNLLLPAIRDRVSVVEMDNGEFELKVVRPDGAPLLNAEAKPATLKDLFLQLRQDQDYAGAFKGLNQSGGGAPNGEGGGGAPNGSLQRSKMTPMQKTAFIKEHGQDKYLALPM